MQNILKAIFPARHAHPFKVHDLGYNLLLALSLLLCIASICMVTQPGFFGFRLYVVLNNSMQPALRPGTLILVRNLPADRLRAGHIIAYLPEGASEPVMARIVGKADDGQHFVTRRNTGSPDTPYAVPALGELGKVSLAIPYVGYFIRLLQSWYGFLACITLPCLWIIFMEVRSIVLLFRAPRAEKTNEDQPCVTQ